MPAPSITATVDPGHPWVRLEVDCYEEFIGKGDGAEVSILRYAGGSKVGVPVRVPSNNAALALSNGRGVIYDTEAPLDVPVTYKAVFRSPFGYISPNTSFEQGIAGWSAAGGATITASAVRAHKGAASALVTFPAPVALAADDFTRPAVANGWGAATTGGAWTVASSTPADFSTNGTTGRLNLNDWESSKRIVIGNATRDSDVYFSASSPVLGVGGSYYGLQVLALARHVDVDEFYALGISFDDAGAVSAIIYCRRPLQSGYQEQWLLEKVVPGVIYAAGTLIRCRAQVIGSMLRIKVWPAANPEPVAWTATITDGALTGSAGKCGMLAYARYENNNALPQIMTVDDYRSNQLAAPYVEGPKAAINNKLRDQTGRGMMWRATALEVGMSAGLRWYDAVQAFISASPVVPVDLAAGAWSEVATKTGTPPPNAAYAAVYFTPFGQVDADGQIWLDNAGVIPDMGGDPNNSTVTATTAAAVTVPSNGVLWLKDPLRPGNDVKVLMKLDGAGCATPAGVVFLALDPEKFSAASAALEVERSIRPVVMAAPRKDVESTLRLLAASFADRDRLEALLAPGSPLLLQAPAVYGMPDRYISVGEVSVARLAVDHRRQWRIFSLPFVAVDAPVGPGQGVPGARWKDLCNQYATWADLTAAGLTWKQIKQGAAG